MRWLHARGASDSCSAVNDGARESTHIANARESEY